MTMRVLWPTCTSQVWCGNKPLAPPYMLMLRFNLSIWQKASQSKSVRRWELWCRWRVTRRGKICVGGPACLLLTTLAPENGLNRMNGFNVSCLPPSPLLCCLLEVLTVFTKPTNPPGGLCPLFVQCFVQDCPFVPTTGHKNSVSSSDCGREAAVRAH